MAIQNEITKKTATPSNPSKGSQPKARRGGPAKQPARAALPKQVTPSKQGRGEGGVRIAEAEFAAGAARRDQVPATSLFEDATEIAFAGRSNVGKSSLLNTMLSRKGLARTSNTPGCTRQINFFDIRIAGASWEKPAAPRTPEPAEPAGDVAAPDTEGAASPSAVAQEVTPFVPKRLIFVDLPGYGYARVSKAEGAAWKQLLESYLQERPTLKAVAILVDVRRGLEQEEADLIEFLQLRPSIQIIIVATKIDRLPLSGQKPALAKLMRGPSGERLAVVGTSAETGVGRDALWSRIFDACRES